MLKFSHFVRQSSENVLSCVNKYNETFVIRVAGIKYYPPKEPVDTSEWPEQRKLRMLEKQPTFVGVKIPKMPKMKCLMRGPELVHTDLIYKGYGIKALLGGRLRFENLEYIRFSLTRRLDTTRMFAVWRIDAPWQPVAKRGLGKGMGGGKGAIHHYVTPVKAERIILEIGGDLHELEARKLLFPIVNSLPFPSRIVSQKDLEDERQKERWINENNKNPYTMEYVIRNNMGGCRKWTTKVDDLWFGKYR